MKLKRFFYARKLKKNIMDNQLPELGTSNLLPEIAAEIHDWAKKNKIVALVWTPEDVQQILATSLLDNSAVTIKQAHKILLAAEEEIHEYLWFAAKRYFENAKKELSND